MKNTWNFTNNGNVLLSHFTHDTQDLFHFAGDHKVSSTLDGTFLLTLEGWVEVFPGDVVVHLFATEDAPTTIITDESVTYTEAGFLVFTREVFDQHFTNLQKVL